MTRLDLDAVDRVTITRARRALAQAERVDYADPTAMAQTIGTLLGTVGALLDILEREPEATP